MKKVLLSLLLLVFGTSAMAQQRIQLRSADKAECVKSDMTSLKASFSFSTIEAQDYESERGTFSWLSLPNTVLSGNVGDPQLPAINQLIAVPFGATPRIEITSYSTTDYSLEDYGMHTLVPRQRPLRKSDDPEEVPFIMNEAVYQTGGLRSEPQATVSVEGIMRGIQLGTMTIEPISYDPVNNTIRVFNDIEVTVSFDGADAQATEDMLLRTYSPAFDAVYAQLFNNRAITDVYTDHPDLYNTPVKMLVICYSGFQGNAALNSWLEWKLQKGYYVDIFYTDETGTSATNIKNFIKTKYNASISAGNAYTYLIVIGDTGQVPQYMTKTIDNTIGQCASDLGYAAVNFTTSSTSNYFPDMYYSRMSVENTTHLTNYMNKVLTYEKFEFADDGNYLNNVLLVAGYDSGGATNLIGKPTVNYGKNNYFNSTNTTYGGFGSGTIRVVVSTSSSQGYSGNNNGVYNGINNGACLVNYTAHGDKQEWQIPQFTAAQAATLTNTGKYFFCIGNCCLTGNYNNTTTTYSPGSSIGATASFGETMIRVPNAGAIAYVGCSPYSYWYEDYYWAVGAHTYSNSGNPPSVSASSKGVYDVMFMDQYWNSASALMYLGNLAVQQAVTNGNTNSDISGSGEGGDCNNSAHYYFQFYHTFGDGSIMPYITKPETNTVSGIPSTVTPGTTSITINAVAGSYVAVTDNSSVIYGVAEANEQGVATVNFTNSIPGSGTLYVVVTRQQYQPWFGTIEIVGGTQYDITATVNPSNGGNVEGAGTYYETAVCTLTAIPNEPEYEFANWTLGNEVVGTEASYSFTVTGDATYTANFTALTSHNITCSTVENGSISADKTTAYKNETVTLTATPNTGYFFVDWTVRDANNQPVAVTNNQFTMPDSDVTVSANFTSGFVVTLNQTEHGTISADQTCVEPGAIVTLTATPDANCVFEAWYVYKTGNPRDVVAVVNDEWFFMPASDVTVQAVFVTEEQHEQTVGSGNTTNGNIPTYIYRRTICHSLTQQIYTAAEIGYNGNITAIAFKANGSATCSLDIYMAHTDKTAFSSTTDWEVMGSVALVFSGNVTFSDNWTTITLDTPFEYDGVSNLNICVVDKSNSQQSNSTRSFSVYSTNANRALYAHSTGNSATDYSNVVGYSNQLASITGTRLTSNNQIKFTIKVPGSAESLTVSPDEIDDFSYLVGQGPSIANEIDIVGMDLQNDIILNAPTNFEISLTESGTYSSSLTIPHETSKRSRNVTTWDFEDGLQGWTVMDVDGDGYNWAHNTQFGGHDGSTGLVYSQSFDNTAGVLHPDNWLISPQVELGGSFSMWAHPQQAAYPAEHFAIEVSITDTDPSSFILLGEWTLSSGNWKQYSVDLSAFTGQMGYIAVRHYNCSDQFYINIDDFVLDTDAAITIEMPVTITPASVFVRMKANLELGDYSGTLTASAGSLTSNVSLSGEVIESTVTQTIDFAQGWNWWAPTVEITLEELETALGTNGISINSYEDGAAQYTDGGWTGTLNEIVTGQMYKIQTSAPCNIELAGTAMFSVSVTIMPGFNWFGYMGADNVALGQAFSRFTPTEGDQIISFENGAAQYVNGGWTGTLHNLQSGQGYVYFSNDTQPNQIIFTINQ